MSGFLKVSERLDRFLRAFPHWESYGTEESWVIARGIIEEILEAGRDVHVTVSPAVLDGDHGDPVHDCIAITVVKWPRELIIDVYPDGRVEFLLSLETSEMGGTVGDRFTVGDLMRYLME